MKKYIRFAKGASILLFLLLLFSWIYYYLHLFAYLPATVFTDSLFQFIVILLKAIPIGILLLFFSLLSIRKPRFRRLHCELSVFLLVLFSLNLLLSIYTSHYSETTATCTILSFTQSDTYCSVTVLNKDTAITLHCRPCFLTLLTVDKNITISYLSNDFLPILAPEIIKIQ